MTAPGWSALSWFAMAAALLAVSPPTLVPSRLGTLRAAGRLVPPAGPHRRAGPRWSVRALRAWPALVVPAALAAAVAVGTRWGAALGLAAGAALGTAGRVALVTVRRRGAAATGRRLVEAVRLLAAEVEAGSSPVVAVQAAGAVVLEWSAAFAAASAAGERGDDLGPALASAAGDGPAAGRAEVAALGHAWRVSARTGAPLADVLARLAGDLAAAEQRRRSVAAALAGPRSSMVLLAGLPVVGLGLGVALGARPFAVLVGSSLGRLLCCTGVVLECAGVLWTQRLTARADSA